MISCEIGTGTSYVNLHGITGIVVPPVNVDRLSEAMLQLAADNLACATMGAAAAKRFADEFTASEMGTKYLDIYKTLTS